jgi:hypothetical protein
VHLQYPIEESIPLWFGVPVGGNVGNAFSGHIWHRLKVSPFSHEFSRLRMPCGSHEKRTSIWSRWIPTRHHPFCKIMDLGHFNYAEGKGPNARCCFRKLMDRQTPVEADSHAFRRTDTNRRLHALPLLH